MLAKNKYKLTKYATIYVNDWEIFNHASDKLKTMKVCMENDIPCPKTALIDSFEEFNDAEFSYPLIVKPRSSWGAKGFHVAQNKSELKNWYKVVSNAYGPTLIQEYVPQNGKQYQVELIMDNHGSCKMFIMMEKVRQYPVDGGSSTLNITMHDEHIKNECIRLMKVLHWNGYASFDLIQDPRDGSVKIMEINPRINSTVKICFACGYDVAKLILEQIYDENVEPCGDYPDGVCLRFFHKDILWLIKSKNRFKSKPSWFMFKHNYDMVFEWDDIKPSLVFSIANLIRLFSYKEHE
jgi:predicted ATP-grasp superfamily ATP-dependent carboligase